MPSEFAGKDAAPESPKRTEVAKAAEMKRLHPFTLLQRFVISAPALFVILLPAIRNPDAAAWVSIASLTLYGVFIIPTIVARYMRFRYGVTPEEVIIHKGVFTYQTRNIPIERIQDIEIEQSLLPRLFGTARLKIETAGSRSTEGVIEYVSLEEARRIRSTVRARQEARRQEIGERPSAPQPTSETGVDARRSADAPAEEGVEAPTGFGAGRAGDGASKGVDVGVGVSVGASRAGRAGEAATEGDGPADGTMTGTLLHAMDLNRVLLSGVFRFSLFYIVAIFSATEYLGLTPEDIGRWFAGDQFEQFAALTEQSPWLVVVSTALMVAFLAWVTGIATNLNRYYGFRLSLDGDKLHTRHGLLTVSESTIPLKKVQALVIRTNPAMAAFGWHRLELQTMGFDPSDRGYRVAVPFGTWSDVMETARVIRPVGEVGPLERVSPLMIRRTFVRYTVALSILAAGAGYFWQPAYWLFASLPALFLLAVAQYRRHGYRLNEDFVFVRRGVFRQNLWILPVDRFQVFYMEQSLFQRRLGLRSVYVDSAGAGVMMLPEVVDLRFDAAVKLLDALHGTFHAHFPKRPAGRAEPSP